MVQVNRDPLERVATIFIDHPPLNISTSKVKDDLRDALHKLENDDAIAVIVLTGKGEKAFSVGSDIKELSAAIENRSVIERAEHENALNSFVENFSKPVIAALNGFALGGGLELALACDMRVCDTETRLGLPEIKLGLFPGGGGSERLVKLLGYPKAIELMLTGDVINAETALKIGLVNRVASKGNALDEALELARQIAQFSVSAIIRIKKLLRDSCELNFSQANRLANTISAEAFHSPEGREGISAFLEKRQPKF